MRAWVSIGSRRPAVRSSPSRRSAQAARRSPSSLPGRSTMGTPARSRNAPDSARTERGGVGRIGGMRAGRPDGGIEGGSLAGLRKRDARAESSHRVRGEGCPGPGRDRPARVAPFHGASAVPRLGGAPAGPRSRTEFPASGEALAGRSRAGGERSGRSRVTQIVSAAHHPAVRPSGLARRASGRAIARMCAGVVPQQPPTTCAPASSQRARILRTLGAQSRCAGSPRRRSAHRGWRRRRKAGRRARARRDRPPRCSAAGS